MLAKLQKLLRKQTSWGVFFIFAFCFFVLLSFPYILKRTAIAPEIYSLAVNATQNKISPYSTQVHHPEAIFGYFKYSPLFIAFYTPLTSMEPPLQRLLWAVMSLSLFLWGLVKIFQFFSIKPSYKLFLFIFLIGRDVDISLRYGQANVILIGALLLATAYLFSKERSALFFSIALLIKPYAVPWAGMFSLRSPRVFLTSLMTLASLILATIPLWGFSFWKVLWSEWLPFALTSGSSPAHPGGLLSISSIAEYEFLRMPVIIAGVLSTVYFFFQWFQLQDDRQRWLWLWLFWCPAILLFGPITESPMYFFAPLTLGLQLLTAQETLIERKLTLTMWGVGFLFFFILPTIQHLTQSKLIVLDWARLWGTCLVFMFAWVYPVHARRLPAQKSAERLPE